MDKIKKVTLQVFKKYGKHFDLWCEFNVGHLTPEAVSKLIAQNSSYDRWCRIKRN